MSNINEYHMIWKTYREHVKTARADYLKKMERLSRYRDSAQGRRDIEECENEYHAALEAARAEAGPRFAKAVESMRRQTTTPDMQPPTDEMLRTLQMMDMRDSIEASEIEAAAKVMGNNDAALRTLRDVLQRKGRILPSGVESFEAKLRDAVDALQEAANNVLLWDGRSSMEIGSDVSRAYHDFKWGGGAPVPANARVAQGMADVEAGNCGRDTARRILGDDVSADVIEALR